MFFGKHLPAKRTSGGAIIPAALAVMSTVIFCFSLLFTILYTFFSPLGARTDVGVGFKQMPKKINKNKI